MVPELGIHEAELLVIINATFPGNARPQRALLTLDSIKGQRAVPLLVSFVELGDNIIEGVVMAVIEEMGQLVNSLTNDSVHVQKRVLVFGVTHYALKTE